MDKYRSEEKKKDPIYQNKPLSIVEENMQYEYQELEENLIRFLLEKVIVMREVPFMKATEKLERNKNINKIYQQLIKIAPTNSFAGKQNQDKFLNAQKNRNNMKPTPAYEGGLGIGMDEESEYKQHGAGKATFKVKQDGQDTKAVEAGKEEPKKPAPGKML